MKNRYLSNLPNIPEPYITITPNGNQDKKDALPCRSAKYIVQIKYLV